MERYEEADKEYKKAVRIKPDVAEIHGNLGILFSETGKKEEAKKEFRIAKEFYFLSTGSFSKRKCFVKKKKCHLAYTTFVVSILRSYLFIMWGNFLTAYFIFPLLFTFIAFSVKVGRKINH